MVLAFVACLGRPLRTFEIIVKGWPPEVWQSYVEALFRYMCIREGGNFRAPQAFQPPFLVLINIIEPTLAPVNILLLSNNFKVPHSTLITLTFESLR